MITLITGGPGTGKTAWLLNLLLDLIKNEPQKLLFIHGVRNLRGIRHETIYCRSQLCDICRAQDSAIKDRAKNDNPPKYVEKWFEWKEPNSLIVIDEVQRIWRPMHGSQVPPESISSLETHRHYGVDFILISQGPHLFHNFIRQLVGRHIHLVAKWHGRKEYEWPECKQDVQSRSDAVERSYTLPKRVYSHYDSAEVHTKQDKRKPLAFYAVIVLMLFAVIGTSFAVYRVKRRIQPPITPEVITSESTNQVNIQQPITKPQSDELTSDQLIKSYTPMVNGVPWSAPAYRELVKPVTFPRIVGCIKSKKPNDYRCACYTQQATLVDVSVDVCSLLVDRKAFNPFQQDFNKNKPELIQAKNMAEGQ